MINALTVLRNFLLQSPITSLTGDRIYAGHNTPPDSYVTGQKAITFRPRGGGLDFTGRLLTESFQFKCYGASPLEAYELYMALVSVLHEANTGGLRYAELEVSGEPLQDPEPANWHFVLTFFRVVLNAGLGA